MKLLCAVCAATLSAAAWASPVAVSPADYNVYALGNIGTSANPYGSDYQGVTGAGGDVFFSGFTLTGLQTHNGTVLYTGGSASLNGGDFLGAIDIGGSVYLESASSGSIYSGGNVEAVNFAVTGDIMAAGEVTLSGGTPSGVSQSFATYRASTSHEALKQHFLTVSDSLSNTPNTPGTFENNFGGLSYTGQSGLNVLTLDSATLKDSWGFQVNAPADAILVINVTDEAAAMDWTNWTFSGGIGPQDVLLNYFEADTLALDQGGMTNILAPKADLTYSAGVFTGSIVAGNLYGGGQVNLGHFDHYNELPEPTTLVTMAIMGFALMARRRSL